MTITPKEYAKERRQFWRNCFLLHAARNLGQPEDSGLYAAECVEIFDRNFQEDYEVEHEDEAMKPPKNEAISEVHPLRQIDLVGDLKGFPLEIAELIVVRMYEWHQKAGKEKHFKLAKAQYFLFQDFPWCHTPEPYRFWNSVIINKDFDVFYEKYPHLKNQ